MSGDAYHITAPSRRRRRLSSYEISSRNIKVSSENIDYVNAHGTSTKGDEIELNAISRLFKEKFL